MFSKTIVLSDSFLDMPLSARCLYFTLGMFADDDGFVNSPKGIMRQCGASQDDMNILIAKSFVIVFDSGVIVIKHWRINNYLRNDRYRESQCTKEKEQLTLSENGTYERGIPNIGIPNVGIPSIGKDSIGKYSIVEDSIDIKEKVLDKSNTKKKSVFIPPNVDEVKEYCDSVGSQIDAESFVAFYESKGWMIGKNKMKSWKSAIVTWEKRNNLKRKPPKKSESKDTCGRFSNLPKELYEELTQRGAIEGECLTYSLLTEDEIELLGSLGVL